MKLKNVRISFDLPYADFIDLERRAEIAGVSIEEMTRQLVVERLLGIG